MHTVRWSEVEILNILKFPWWVQEIGCFATVLQVRIRTWGGSSRTGVFCPMHTITDILTMM